MAAATPLEGLDIATEQSDVLALLDVYREAEASGFSAHALRAIGLDPGSVHAASRAEKQLTRLVRRKGGASARAAHRQAYDDALRLSILAGFPDRVARRKKQGSRDLALAEEAPRSSPRRAPCGTHHGWSPCPPSSCAAVRSSAWRAASNRGGSSSSSKTASARSPT